MSSAVTVHWTCDNCGKAVDVGPSVGRGGLPDGWGDLYPEDAQVCSEACGEIILVAKARDWASSLFAPKVQTATGGN